MNLEAALKVIEENWPGMVGKHHKITKEMFIEVLTALCSTASAEAAECQPCWGYGIDKGIKCRACQGTGVAKSVESVADYTASAVDDTAKGALPQAEFQKLVLEGLEWLIGAENSVTGCRLLTALNRLEGKE